MKALATLCGVIAALTLAASGCRAGTLRILYEFQGGTDGISPSGGVAAQGGVLYGLTNGGGGIGCGGFGCGTAYRVDVASGKHKVLYSFSNSPDAASPFSFTSPLLRDHVLYGTTVAGGTVYPGEGAVFAVNVRSGAETVLDSLGGAAGYDSLGGLTAFGGSLFGTTALGGTGIGTVFKADPSGGLTVVHNFSGGPNDGASPIGNLVAQGGLLYGTTQGGGKSVNCGDVGCGTVFQLDPATGQEKVLHNFVGTDGNEPTGLIYDNGELYGVTEGGGDASCGALGCGTIFRIDLKTGNFNSLYLFQGGSSDGQGPNSVAMLNGVLYGTTAAGGPANIALCSPFGCGTLFQYKAGLKPEKVLQFFDKLDDGNFPLGVTVLNGVLYGATLAGGGAACNGGAGCGVVFSYTP